MKTLKLDFDLRECFENNDALDGYGETITFKDGSTILAMDYPDRMELLAQIEVRIRDSRSEQSRIQRAIHMSQRSNENERSSDEYCADLQRHIETFSNLSKVHRELKKCTPARPKNKPQGR